MAARTPNPMGCRWCSIDQHGHGRQYVEPIGWHQWQPPTQQQIKNRMLARRAERNDRA
jgi:hypothetical protein